MTNHKQGEYRIIKTARNIDTINDAIDSGFFPLVKQLQPLKELYRTLGVYRNRKTNKLEETSASSGMRQYGRYFSYEDIDEWELVLPFHSYYPYTFDNDGYNRDYAAYLIPSDMKIGEIVILEDLIEDYYGGSFWDRPIRLKTLKAKWDGQDLSILYEPGVDDVCHMVG